MNDIINQKNPPSADSEKKNPPPADSFGIRKKKNGKGTKKEECPAGADGMEGFYGQAGIYCGAEA